MWDEIRRLTGEGLTVLLTTHYLEEADELASALAIVDRGEVVVEGTPDELKRGLRGDAIHVELTEDRELATLRAAINGSIHGLGEIQLSDRVLHARAEDGARAVPAVLTALEDAGIGIAAVTVARPSLDDVYLRHAGRTFTAAESETENTNEEETR
jgi:ABC-2 type transport system ATP-binding protein